MAKKEGNKKLHNPSCPKCHLDVANGEERVQTKKGLFHLRCFREIFNNRLSEAGLRKITNPSCLEDFINHLENEVRRLRREEYTEEIQKQHVEIKKISIEFFENSV